MKTYILIICCFFLKNLGAQVEDLELQRPTPQKENSVKKPMAKAAVEMKQVPTEKQKQEEIVIENGPYKNGVYQYPKAPEEERQ